MFNFKELTFCLLSFSLSFYNSHGLPLSNETKVEKYNLQNVKNASAVIEIIGDIAKNNKLSLILVSNATEENVGITALFDNIARDYPSLISSAQRKDFRLSTADPIVYQAIPIKYAFVECNIPELAQFFYGPNPVILVCADGKVISILCKSYLESIGQIIQEKLLKNPQCIRDLQLVSSNSYIILEKIYTLFKNHLKLQEI